MSNHDVLPPASPQHRRLPGAGWSIALAVALMLALRLPLIGIPGSVDEGGYLLVAGQWHGGGPFVYGSLFVDRPPLLLLLFRLAGAWGGIDALRVLAIVLVAVMVVAAGWAGRVVGGVVGARWAAFTAAALASSPILGADQVDGELLAAPLVVLSCACLLAAVLTTTRPSRQVALLAAAGFTASAAVLVKQNFVDAFVFAIAYLVAAVLTKRITWSIAVRTVGVFLAGALVPIIATAVWAAGWATGLGHLWFAMYGFRSQALDVLVTHSPKEVRDRLVTLLIDTVSSGVTVLAVAFVVIRFRSLKRLDPMTVAVTAMLAFAVPGIALGGNYWSHYLIELVPALALCSACMAGTVSKLRWSRAAVALVLVSAVVAAAGTIISGPDASHRPELAMESWLHHAARSSDSIVVSYGLPDLVEASGLRSGYPYLWRLPMQTLDPHLRRFTARLDGPGAPTWVVEWEPFTSWGGAAAGLRVAAAVRAHYRRVADFSGHVVYLHRGAIRDVAGASHRPCCHQRRIHHLGTTAGRRALRATVP